MYYQIPLRANPDNNRVFEPSEHQDEIYDELEDVLSNIPVSYQQTDVLADLILKHAILGFPIIVFKSKTDQLNPKFIGVYRGNFVTFSPIFCRSDKTVFQCHDKALLLDC